MAFLRDKSPPPNEPTKWDLGDLQPGFAKHLTNLTALRVVFDQKCDGLLGFLSDEKAALAELNQQPDAKSLLKWAEEHGVLQKEWGKLNTFNSLYRQEYFKNAPVQEFSQHAQNRLNAINHACVEAWREMALPKDVISRLIAEEPKLKSFKDWLAPTQAEKKEFLTEEQKRAQAEAIDSRLVDPTYLYRLVNSSTTMPKSEKATQATQMFNAKMFQEWKAANKEKTTPLGGFAKRNGISEEFAKSYIENLPELRREMTDALKKTQNPEAIETPKISWEEATDIVVTALKRFHPEMGEIAKMAIEENWIHAAPSPEKFHNAFANGNAKQTFHPSNHSYILMNFDGSPRSVKTLGHEIGHAIVHYLEGDSQLLSDGTTIRTVGEPAMEVSRTGGHTPIEGKYQPIKPQGKLEPGALHETFAHFSETLAMDELMHRQTDPRVKESLTHTRRSQYKHTVTSSGHNEFESRLYALAKSHHAAPFPKAQIARAWRNTVGANVNATDDDLVLRAAQVTHFMNYKPHYYLSYALAEIAAQTLTDKFEQGTAEERREMADKWVGIMREAPKHTYGSALKEMGIELTNAEQALAPVKRRFYGMAEKAKVVPEADPSEGKFSARLKAALRSTEQQGGFHNR